MIRSSWKLTYDPDGTPIVLVDIGDRLAAEIRWPSQRGGEVVPLLDAEDPFLRDSGNRAVNVSFDRMEPGTSHAGLCKAVMARLISHEALVKKPLKIEAAGVVECHWLAAGCLVPTLEPGIRVTGSHEMATRYTIVFASLARVDTEEEPLETGDPAPTDPGAFAPDAAAPGDPGGFPPVAPTPGDPGDFTAEDAAPAPTAMILSGVGGDLRNGTLLQDFDETFGRNFYTATLDGVLMIVAWQGDEWLLYQPFSSQEFYSEEDVPEPHLVTVWLPRAGAVGAPVFTPVY